MKMGLADLAGWHLMVRCTACTDDRYLPIDVLLTRYGSQHTLGRIVPRLRCFSPRAGVSRSACGSMLRWTRRLCVWCW
jgi:hypothetical protein